MMAAVLGCSSSGDGADPASGGASGTGGGASDELCGRRPGGSMMASHVLRYETADHGTVVQLVRTWVSVGTGESQIYRLDEFHLSQAGVPTCVTDAASLEYVNSHHNWTDVARATTGSRRYEVAMTLDMPHTLTELDTDGSVVTPATPLVPTGSPAFCWTCPGRVGVAISEVMLVNVATLPDEQAEYEPWIELFNATSEPVALSGWTLSDDFTRRDAWPLPALTLPQTGVLVLFADGQPEQGELHTSFALSRDGGELVLTAPDGVTDGGLLLAPQAGGQSLGYSWTAGAYVLGTPTPNAPPPEP